MSRLFIVTLLESKVKVKVTQSCPTLRDPMDCSLPAPPSMGFSRQEYWSGLPFPSPGDLPDTGIEPWSPAFQADALTSEPPGKPKNTGVGSLYHLQGIFQTQESNQGLLHCRQILYQLSYKLPALNIIEQIQVSFFMAMKGKSN